MLKSKLKVGEVTVGSWIQLAEANIVELMASAGFDWLAVDMEHGSVDVGELPNLFRAMAETGCFPMVRVPANDELYIRRALDAGAGGVIVPMVNSREQAAQAAAFVRYPPCGARGIGFCRANRYGQQFDSYFRNHNDNVVLIVQIEHIDGVRNAEEILSVEGVDGYMIGPYDLSGSMNVTGQFEHPDFAAAVLAAMAAGKKTRKACGIHIVIPDVRTLQARIKEGYTFIAYGIDTVFLAKSAAEAMRQASTLLPGRGE